MTNSKTWPTVGFIGTGVISSAIAAGLCQDESRPYPIVVSPRNQEKAQALAEAFPERVRIAQDNQQVADEADWLFVAVLPKIGQEIYQSLRFRPEQYLINLVADVSPRQILEWTGPKAGVAHVVPLSFIAHRYGPIVQTPPNQAITDFLAPLGQVVAVETNYDAAVLAAITAYIASYFTLLAQTMDWGKAMGLSEDVAKSYTTAMFAALSRQADEADPARLRELAEEMTPGGLNFMAKTHIQENNGFDLWLQPLAPIMQRILKNK